MKGMGENKMLISRFRLSTPLTCNHICIPSEHFRLRQPDTILSKDVFSRRHGADHKKHIACVRRTGMVQTASQCGKTGKPQRGRSVTPHLRPRSPRRRGARSHNQAISSFPIPARLHPTEDGVCHPLHQHHDWPMRLIIPLPRVLDPEYRPRIHRSCHGLGLLGHAVLGQHTISVCHA
jgi:hypothetical protein